ncbi:hypothetical protein RFI_36391, partial [Reticulomyxa filosa]
MNAEENEKKKEQMKIGVVPVSFAQSCFKKDWIVQLNEEKQINHLICLICKQIANHPLEITCPEHENMDESTIVGKHCLQKFLDNNGNTCPINSHSSCQYQSVKLLQRQINNLIVICPRQFEQDLEAPGSREEGKTLMRPGCNFKGSIKEVNDHLNNSCPLKPLACWFQPFGCDHSCLKGELEEHLVLQKKCHFDLVVKHVESLQQKIQHSQ